MPRAPYSQGPAPTAARTACSSTRTAPCALATSAKGSIGAAPQARLAGGGADDAVVPTFCFNIEAVLGMRFCEPEQLIARRSRCTPRGRACQKYSPSSGIHTISHTTHECTGSLHCLQLCAAAFWCSKTSLHAAQANGPSLPFIALRPVSAPPSERVGVCRVAGVTTLDSGSAPSKNSRQRLARI